MGDPFGQASNGAGPREVTWRFAKYQDFPYLWARMVHPGLDLTARLQVLHRFYKELKPCCRNTEFSSKLHALVGDPVRLHGDSDFQRLLKTWVVSHRFTGMWTERLLAKIRRASMFEDADAERIVSAGFLTQALGEHIRLGRADPRAPTRAHLLAKKVKLRCAGAPKPNATKPRSPFINFMMKAEAERRQRGVKLDGVAYKQWRAERKEDDRCRGSIGV